jgi:hypothetical protein
MDSDKDEVSVKIINWSCSHHESYLGLDCEAFGRNREGEGMYLVKRINWYCSNHESYLSYGRWKELKKRDMICWMNWRL